MSNLGLGVMLRMMCGNDGTVDAYHKAIGKTIKHIELSEDTLTLTFDDASILTVRDAGQSCCEDRYMRTDDQFEDFIGVKLLDIELKQAPDMEHQYGTHEVQFLELMTSKGALTMASHNEHNGYYGGFAIVLNFKENDAAQ
jgi:hypothetical protein